MLLLAVLEKRSGLRIANCDAYINVIGGLSINETAADLAAVLAIAILDLLNRLSIAPTDARRDAAKAAEDYLKDIAAGRIVPEDYAADDAVESKGAGPLADDGPRRTLGGGIW